MGVCNLYSHLTWITVCSGWLSSVILQPLRLPFPPPLHSTNYSCSLHMTYIIVYCLSLGISGDKLTMPTVRYSILIYSRELITNC